MINGFNTGKISVIQKNKLLKKSPIARRIIFTDWCGNRNRSLEKIFCDLAESYTGAAKSSGAGGGDCGIVIFRQKIWDFYH